MSNCYGDENTLLFTGRWHSHSSAKQKLLFKYFQSWIRKTPKNLCSTHGPKYHTLFCQFRINVCDNLKLDLHVSGTENLSKAACLCMAEAMLILVEGVSLPELQLLTAEWPTRPWLFLDNLSGRQLMHFEEEDHSDCSPGRKLLMEQNAGGYRSRSLSSTCIKSFKSVTNWLF